MKDPINEIKQLQLSKNKVILIFISIRSMLSINKGDIILIFRTKDLNVISGNT